MSVIGIILFNNYIVIGSRLFLARLVQSGGIQGDAALVSAVLLLRNAAPVSDISNSHSHDMFSRRLQDRLLLAECDEARDHCDRCFIANSDSSVASPSTRAEPKPKHSRPDPARRGRHSNVLKCSQTPPHDHQESCCLQRKAWPLSRTYCSQPHVSVSPCLTAGLSVEVSGTSRMSSGHLSCPAERGIIISAGNPYCLPRSFRGPHVASLALHWAICRSGDELEAGGQPTRLSN